MVVYWKKQRLIDMLEARVARWPEVDTGPHERGGREFSWQGKEIGHVHYNGDLDILFNKRTRDELLATGRVQEHKWVPNSGWTTFVLGSEQDLDAAEALLRQSLAMKQARAGSDKIL